MVPTAHSSHAGRITGLDTHQGLRDKELPLTLPRRDTKLVLEVLCQCSSNSLVYLKQSVFSLSPICFAPPFSFFKAEMVVSVLLYTNITWAQIYQLWQPSLPELQIRVGITGFELYKIQSRGDLDPRQQRMLKRLQNHCMHFASLVREGIKQCGVTTQQKPDFKRGWPVFAGARCQWCQLFAGTSAALPLHFVLSSLFAARLNFP